MIINMLMDSLCITKCFIISMVEQMRLSRGGRKLNHLKL
nr:MAG TPA: hypothetical protein [Caudoviricetes sp.]